MSVSGLLIRLSAVLCLFQLPLVNVFGAFSYFDELLAFAMACCFIARTLSVRRISKVDLAAIAFFVAFVISAIVSTMLSDVPRSFGSIMQDFLSVVKVFACYIGAKYLFDGRDDCAQILAWVAKLTKATVVIAFVCLILSHLGAVHMLSTQVRMGIKCFEFIYGSPGMFSQYCVLYAVVLLADLSLPGNRKKKWLYIVMLFAIWAATLRTRAFVMIFIVLFLYIVAFNSAVTLRVKDHGLLKRLASPTLVIPCVVVVVAFAADQVDLYFGSLSSARSYLLSGGIRVFNDYFPLGAGFATYGTESARVWYSPLYTEYGLNAHWALGANGTELTDTFWPAIMAEFGALGLVFYIVPLAIMLVQIVRRCASDKSLLICAVFFDAYVLIASTATGVFFSYTVSDCMLFIGMIMGLALKKRRFIQKKKG